MANPIQAARTLCVGIAQTLLVHTQLTRVLEACTVFVACRDHRWTRLIFGRCGELLWRIYAGPDYLLGVCDAFSPWVKHGETAET